MQIRDKGTPIVDLKPPGRQLLGRANRVEGDQHRSKSKESEW